MTGPMYFFLCAGFPFLLIGGIWWATILMFLLRVKETKGRIVSIQSSGARSGKSSTSRTLAEFQTEDGKTVQFTEYTGKGMGFFEFFILIPILLVRYLYQKTFTKVIGVTYDDGDAVQILYDPINPSRAHINNFHYLHARPLFFIMLGLLISMNGIPAVHNFFSKIGEFMDKLL